MDASDHTLIDGCTFENVEFEFKLAIISLEFQRFSNRILIEFPTYYLYMLKSIHCHAD